MTEMTGRAASWKQLCRDNGWLQDDILVAPEGHQLYFAFSGVSTVAGGEGANAPGFFVSSDVARTSMKAPPSGATVSGDFIVAKPEKGYNVAVWTYFLWEDLVSIQMVKIDAERVI